MYILGIVAKIQHNFGENINKQSAKKGSECTICIIFSKILSGRPRPLTPYCKRIKKNPLLDFILFSTANLKILPHHVYRRLEISRQNNTQFLGRNQHELCKKLGIEYTICFQFSKTSPENPESPTLLREDKKFPLGLYMIV